MLIRPTGKVSGEKPGRASNVIGPAQVLSPPVLRIAPVPKMPVPETPAADYDDGRTAEGGLQLNLPSSHQDPLAGAADAQRPGVGPSQGAGIDQRLAAETGLSLASTSVPVSSLISCCLGPAVDLPVPVSLATGPMVTAPVSTPMVASVPRVSGPV